MKIDPSVQELTLEKEYQLDNEEPMVDEDDWDLGPACGLDHEECESCQ